MVKLVKLEVIILSYLNKLMIIGLFNAVYFLIPPYQLSEFTFLLYHFNNESTIFSFI